MEDADADDRLRALIALPARRDRVARVPQLLDGEGDGGLRGRGGLEGGAGGEGLAEEGDGGVAAVVLERVDALRVVDEVGGQGLVREFLAVACDELAEVVGERRGVAFEQAGVDAGEKGSDGQEAGSSRG